VEGEVADIELLFPRLTRYVEEKLASVLNPHLPLAQKHLPLKFRFGSG
jgi:hypothetical protein